MLENKRKKLTLDEVELQMEVLTKEEMKILKGGGDGTYESPYTWAEYESLLDTPSFVGGWVIDDKGSCFYGLGQVDLGSEQPPKDDEPTYPHFNFYDYGSDDEDYSGTMHDTSRDDLGSPDNWYYNEYGSYNEEDQGGTYYYGGYSGGTPSTPTKDGIDINSSHFTFKTQENQAFHQQLTNILSTNKTIKGLLGYFKNGVVHLTFGIKDLDIQTLARTDYKSQESYHIEFNSKVIGQNGWSLNYKGKNNIDYDFSKASTTEERLLITLIHEVIHAKHYATYEDAFREAQKISPYKEPYPNDIANNLLSRGYSQEFVEIYLIKDCEGGWHYNSVGRNDRAHDYMRKYDHGVIDKALEEYRRDRGL